MAEEVREVDGVEQALLSGRLVRKQAEEGTRHDGGGEPTGHHRVTD